MQGRVFGLIGMLLIVGAGWASDPEPIAPIKIPLDDLSPARRDVIKHVLDRPTMSVSSSKVTFVCKPEQYRWLLDHPDRGVIAWRRLGAKCVSILPHGQNSFIWSDDKGSEVVWETIQNGAGQQVWFAEGNVKPGPLLPAVPVKAVVVLRYAEIQGPDKSPAITHQTHLYIHTDSKSAAFVAKTLGNSSQRLAEQALDQLQFFFSEMSRYLQHYPERSAALLSE